MVWVGCNEMTRLHLRKKRLGAIELPFHHTFEVLVLGNEPIARHRSDQYAVVVPRQTAEAKR
jgi:hypothetical protein